MHLDARVDEVEVALAELGHALKIVESMPKLGKRYFNFVDTSIEVHRPGYSELVVRGLPQPVVLAYKALSHAYLMRTMELAHIRNPRHTWIGISDDGVK